MLRSPLPDESTGLIALAVATGLFTQSDADALLGGVLEAYGTGALPEGHTVLVCTGDGSANAVGWAYVAPDDHASGVWNLWWIGVAPAGHGGGYGRELLEGAEDVVRRAGGRLMVVETSAFDALARARRFYNKHGYAECGQIPDFYGVGEAKVIFARRLSP